jgi:hypothetical protein
VGAEFKLSDIPESEKTPLVLLLLEIIMRQAEEIRQLKDEVARLKGNPARPKLKPSTVMGVTSNKKIFL